MTQEQHDLIEEHYEQCLSNRRFGFKLCKQMPIECVQCPFLSDEVVVMCMSRFDVALDEYIKLHPELTL